MQLLHHIVKKNPNMRHRDTLQLEAFRVFLAIFGVNFMEMNAPRLYLTEGSV